MKIGKKSLISLLTLCVLWFNVGLVSAQNPPPPPPPPPPVNNNSSLEHEADVMGAIAASGFTSIGQNPEDGWFWTFLKMIR